jgi:hypothetical protein
MATVAELAASRQKLCEIFNGREIDDDKIDLPEFKRIITIETKIAKATFKTDADKMAGDLILSENKPSCWDNFQCALYARMNQFQ